jgi:hypothetical protein
MEWGLARCLIASLLYHRDWLSWKLHRKGRAFAITPNFATSFDKSKSLLVNRTQKADIAVYFDMASFGDDTFVTLQTPFAPDKEGYLDLRKSVSTGNREG